MVLVLFAKHGIGNSAWTDSIFDFGTHSLRMTPYSSLSVACFHFLVTGLVGWLVVSVIPKSLSTLSIDLGPFLHISAVFKVGEVVVLERQSPST